MRHESFLRLLPRWALALGLPFLTASWLLAADAPPPPAAPPSPVAGPAAPAATPWTKEQLKQLVGPVALYPDAVLSSLLPATCFPLDIVQAARWLEQQGGKVEKVPTDKPWDASVLALLQFPDVLRWLNDNLEWVQQMGSAVAAQQADVLAAVQAFRRDAQQAGNLRSSDHLKVTEVGPSAAESEAPTVIVVESAQPEVVYIPVYDPVTVVQPAYYWPAEPLITFGLGVAVGAIGAWGWHSIDWGYGWWWGAGYYYGGGGHWHGPSIYVGDVHGDHRSHDHWGHDRAGVGPGRNTSWQAPRWPDTWRRHGGDFGGKGAGFSKPTKYSPRSGGPGGGPGTTAGGVHPPSVGPPVGGRAGTSSGFRYLDGAARGTARTTTAPSLGRTRTTGKTFTPRSATTGGAFAPSSVPKSTRTWSARGATSTGRTFTTRSTTTARRSTWASSSRARSSSGFYQPRSAVGRSGSASWTRSSSSRGSFSTSRGSFGGSRSGFGGSRGGSRGGGHGGGRGGHR